jgi:hypothetical protein
MEPLLDEGITGRRVLPEGPYRRSEVLQLRVALVLHVLALDGLEAGMHGLAGAVAPEQSEHATRHVQVHDPKRDTGRGHLHPIAEGEHAPAYARPKGARHFTTARQH